MMVTKTRQPSGSVIDIATVIGIASIAYVVAIAVHEHVGHGLACAALGGQLRELGALYIDCDYRQMGDIAIRLVALAGPLASLLLGIAGFWGVGRFQTTAPLKLLLWLLGSIGWMTATGYLLFSGVMGLGDFGVSRDGMLYQLQPEWLWRAGVIIAGGAGYALSIWQSVHWMEHIIGGEGKERIQRALRLALTSYLTGGVAYLIVGALNPYGLVILLISAVAASWGGTSGLAWEMTLMKEKRQTDQPPLQIERDWRWIAASVGVIVVYTAVLGPSIRL